jgi:hypothetical protein
MIRVQMCEMGGYIGRVMNQVLAFSTLCEIRSRGL